MRSARLDETGATETRDRIIAATITTLHADGIVATSARSIARRGNFNQALIFYHFHGMGDLLVHVLQRVSAELLAQYESALEGADEARAALRIAKRLYQRDLREGRTAVLVELMGGASSVPDLGRELSRCFELWLALAEQQIGRLLGSDPLLALLKPRDIALALVAVALGSGVIDHVAGEARASGPLFRVADRLARARD